MQPPAVFWMTILVSLLLIRRYCQPKQYLRSLFSNTVHWRPGSVQYRRMPIGIPGHHHRLMHNLCSGL